MLSVGPLAFPSSFIAVLFALALGVGVARVMTRKLVVDVNTMAWRVAFAALVAARLGHLWQYREAYAASPLDMLDIRDGGWTPEVGFAVAWLYALASTQGMPALRRPMVCSLATATVAFLVSSVALAVTAAQTPQLQATEVVTREGGSASLAKFKGKPTVLNLWATWCPPCLREMPILAEAQETQPSVNFVFLNQGDSADRVKTFLRAHGLNLKNVLLDPKGKGTAEYGLGGLPTTLFFDAEGHLVDAQLGGLSRAVLVGKLSKIAPKPDPTSS